MDTMFEPTAAPPSPTPQRSKFRIRRVHGRRSTSHASSTSSSTTTTTATATTTITPTSPSSPPSSPSAQLSRDLTRTSLTPIPISPDIAKRPPQLPASPRRAAMRASKDAKSCPALPVPTDIDPETLQPRPMRRGSLPAPKLPPLNFGNLRSLCPVADDLHTARRRVEAISSSLSRFRNYLYVCGDVAARDLPTLRRAGVTHVVNLAGKQAPNYHQPTLRYLRLYVCDDYREEMTPLFDAIAAFIDEARCAGGAVVVHCRQGISRSVTAAIAYVMMKEGLALEDALREMRSCRPIANPNNGFFEALRMLQNRMRHGRRSSQLFVVRRHAPNVSDKDAPVVAQKAPRSRALDEREAYILQRIGRRGVVVWHGKKAETRAVQNAVSIAKRIAEQERVDAVRFPDGGAAKAVVVAKQGDSDRLEQELVKVSEEG